MYLVIRQQRRPRPVPAPILVAGRAPARQLVSASAGRMYLNFDQGRHFQVLCPCRARSTRAVAVYDRKAKSTSIDGVHQIFKDKSVL